MKTILRNVVLHAVSLFILWQLVPGVKIVGGLQTYLVAGVMLAFISAFVRPILNILTLPFNLVTMGAFSFLSNALILYILTAFVPQIMISPFTFQGASFLGFIIPKIVFNLFFAYIVSAFVLSAITSVISWLIK
ncbi:MAG: phage holin family protein [Candidatus Levybacteria bacterium]|nr:phage holin family protein [Candidatus Levybacteria bacterium]